MYIRGNYDTDKAGIIMVVFEECVEANYTGRPDFNGTCASKEVREEWMKFKYINTIDNSKKLI